MLDDISMKEGRVVFHEENFENLLVRDGYDRD